MRLKDILTPSFRTFRHPSQPVVVVETDSDFCTEVVAQGIMTHEQMEQAASTYRLGKSRSGKCIFWLIDRQDIVRDGHIGQWWVTQMLRQRHPNLARYIVARHCLFGLHLLGSHSTADIARRQPVAIVDSEPSAVILSVLYPTLTWMASGPCPTIDMMEPLIGHRVTLFPRTDPLQEYYTAALLLSQQAKQAYGLDISVSDILERHATPEQKARKIDIADLLELRIEN